MDKPGLRGCGHLYSAVVVSSRGMTLAEGFSADVCCWRRHADCWRDGYDFETCCPGYNTKPFQDVCRHAVNGRTC